MNKYRKKPVVIEAILYDGTNRQEVYNVMGVDFSLVNLGTSALSIATLEGVMECKVGDYVIKGIKGEFYPCKPDIFEATYEEVEGEK